MLTALGEVLEQHLGYVRDVHYLRLDGAVTAADRARLIRQFNSDSTKARVSAQAVHRGGAGGMLLSVGIHWLSCIDFVAPSFFV